MKQFKHYIAALTLLLTSSIFAQNVEPLIGQINHNDAARTCLMIELDPSEDKVEDSWEDFMKKNYGVKLNGTGIFGTGNLLAEEEVVIPNISEKRLNFYTLIQEKDGKTEMKVFASLGIDVYINPTDYPNEYKAIRTMMTKYLSSYLPTYYQDEIDEAQGKLKTLQKRDKKLNKKMEKMEKKIEKLESDIKENKEEQETNETALKTTNSLLEQRKKALESVLKQIGSM